MTAPARERDGWVIVGMAIAAASAATASFTGLRGLALVAGWPERLAWLLPITIDAYAMTSARVWLAKAGGHRARRFAQSNAIGAITASIVGNAAYHMISVGLLSVSWPIVVLVGAVPAAVLGLTAHLHALRTLDRDEDEDIRARGQPERTEDGPRTKASSEDELMAAARAADARYRAEHDGRPITRDALRSALHIAGPKATELRRRLAAEKNPDRKEAHTTA